MTELSMYVMCKGNYGATTLSGLDSGMMLILITKFYVSLESWL